MSAVFDASTLLRAALAERAAGAGSPSQLIRPALAERYGLAAPALVAFEVANVVHRKEPRRFGASAAARADVVAAVLQGIELVNPEPRSVRATGLLVERFRLTAFDAAYLELAASREGSVLVTEDARLAAAGRRHLGPRRTFNAAGALAAMDAGKL